MHLPVGRGGVLPGQRGLSNVPAPPGRAIEAKESSVVNSTASLRWVSAHDLLRSIIPAQRKIAEGIVLRRMAEMTESSG